MWKPRNKWAGPNSAGCRLALPRVHSGLVVDVSARDARLCTLEVSLGRHELPARTIIRHSSTSQRRHRSFGNVLLLQQIRREANLARCLLYWAITHC